MVKEWKRHLIQLYAGLLYNAHLRGFIDGGIYVGKTKALCVPGLNCYSCPGAAGACPLGALQNALASSGNRIGFYIFGILMLYGLLLGRTICGWLCPFGLVQELLHKIPTPKIRKNRVTRALTWVKYGILIVFAMIIPLWYGLSKGIPVPGFCKYICPAGTVEGAVGLLANEKNSSLFSMLGIFFTRKFVILMLVALACIFCYRSFCRFLCPLGALYGMFSRLTLIGIKVDADRCSGCGACVRACPMDVRRVGDHECIHCAKCVHVCRENAISLRAGSLKLIAPEKELAKETPDAKKRRIRGIRIAQIAAVALLVFALVGCNLPGKTAKNSSTNNAGQNHTSQNVNSENQQNQQNQPPATESSGLTGNEADTEETSTEKSAALEAVTEEAITEEAAAEEMVTEAEAAEEAVTEAEAAEEAVTEGAVTEEAVTEETAAEEAAVEGVELPVGHEVGERLEDFAVECVDGSQFHLDDMKGKVVIINLWATYCGPCVKELPHFSDLYQAHPDELAILAVHSSLVTEDVADFLKNKGWDIPFAVDTDDDQIWGITGGSTTLPQTIVLNTRGEVIYNQVGSVTPELLEALFNKALDE